MASSNENSTTASASLTRRQFSFFAAASVFGALASKHAFGQEHHAHAASAGELTPKFPLTAHVEDNFAALMEYVPSVDPDAAFFRSLVPRAARIAPFAPTQAHPKLSAQPQVATLTGCYRTLGADYDERYRRIRYGTPPEGGLYVSRMIGYHDVVVSWSGPGVIPNPALTDAAHRNGALCLGTIFQPDKRIFDSSVVPAKEVAAKFVELAIYFGFDGYFMNFELGTPQGHAQILDLLGMMHEEAHRRGKTDFYIQFYDGSADMNKLMPVTAPNSPLVPAASFADSTMLDQGWSGYSMTHGCCSGEPTDAASVYEYCRKHGLDPYKSAYFGYQLYPGPGYLGLSAPSVIQPNDSATAYGSLQVYSFEDGLFTMQRALDKAPGHTSALTPEEEYYSLERAFFSGQSQNPALDNTPTAEQAHIYATVAEGKRRYADYSPTEDHANDQVKLPITYGVANFTVEHSVIGSFPFLTRFNLGAGDAFFIDGAKQSDHAWFNMGIQDLLPTWQWWLEPMYGALDRNAAQYAPLDVRFDRSIAYDGGASLHISGKLDGRDGIALHLYKTKLAIENADDLALQLVWQGTGECLSVGLIFEDEPGKTEWIGLADTAHVSRQSIAQNWTRSQVALSPYRGRILAALLLGFRREKHADAAVDLHIGEIYAGSPLKAETLTAPADFKVEAHAAGTAPNTLHARLRWTMRNSDAYYDLYSVSAANARTWIGRVTGDRYFAENVSADTGTSFELVATSRETPLLRSQAAKAALTAS
ncbi:endo-beta-N-acetylglucosaminidase [Silvibacterium sp.]|uniref:endo-beta-N-acetylglucosaminidase n=1 Tax=Silvibacterium sp. TaxID=1964179 RepID=UPI0039E42795